MSLNHLVIQNDQDVQLDVHFNSIQSVGLQAICEDQSILNLNPTTSGTLGQVLQSDGNNGLIFVNSGGAGGMAFNGLLPVVGQHIKSTDTSGNLYEKSTLIEDGASFNFGSKNIDCLGTTTSENLRANVLVQTSKITSATSSIDMSAKDLINIDVVECDDIKVTNDDSSQISYKLPSVGTSTQLLSSNGDGTLGWQNFPSFSGITHTGINPVAKQYTCYSSTDPNIVTNARLRETSSFDLSLDGLNITNANTITANDLIQKNTDGSYTNLKLPNVGVDLQYISSDGLGNVKWETLPPNTTVVDFLPPGGGPAVVNGLSKYVDILGNIENTSITEQGGNVNFGSQNLTNISTTNTTNLNVNSVAFPDSIPTDLQLVKDRTQNISAYSAGSTTFSGTINGTFNSGGTNTQYVSGDGSLVTPSNSQQSNIYLYRTEINSGIPPPTNGRILYALPQSLIVGSTNTLYVSHLTDDGVDIENFLYNVSISNQIYIQHRNISGDYQIWDVSAAITVVVGSYIEIPVTLSYGTHIFPNNDAILMAVLLNTDSIDTRLDLLETKTQNQTGALGLTSFSGNVSAGSFIKSGASSSDVLLGDGSVNSTVISNATTALGRTIGMAYIAAPTQKTSFSQTIDMGANRVSSSFVPVSNTDLTNKLYTDGRDALKLNLTGGTLTGTLNMGANKITTTYLALNPEDVVNRDFADLNYATNTVLGDYLLKSGGTMSGNINMNNAQIQNASKLDMENGTIIVGHANTNTYSSTSDNIAVGTANTIRDNQQIFVGVGNQSLSGINITLGVGTSNQVNSFYSTAVGNSNVITGQQNFVFGNDNTTSANNAHCFGNGISNSIQNSICFGDPAIQYMWPNSLLCNLGTATNPYRDLILSGDLYQNSSKLTGSIYATSGATTLSAYGLLPASVITGLGGANFAITQSNASIYDKIIKVRCTTTSVAAYQDSGYLGGSTFYRISSGLYVGMGWSYNITFGIGDTYGAPTGGTAGMQVGFVASTAAVGWSAVLNPDTTVNWFGIGHTYGDSVISFYNKGSAGTGSKIATAFSTGTPSTLFFSLTMINTFGSNDVLLILKEMISGTTVIQNFTMSGTLSVSNTTRLYPVFTRMYGAVAPTGAGIINFGSMTLTA